MVVAQWDKKGKEAKSRKGNGEKLSLKSDGDNEGQKCGFDYIDRQQKRACRVDAIGGRCERDRVWCTNVLCFCDFVVCV